MRPSLSLLLVTAVFLRAQSAAPDYAQGLANFHQVNEHIYRGGQPSAAGLEALHAMGVKTVLDLRSRSDGHGASEQRMLESQGITYVNIAMPALGAPTPESISRALNLLLSDKAWPVFVHCQRGADRTGTVVACLRISNDCWTNGRALEEAERFGLATFQTGKKHFILAWGAPTSGHCLDHLIPLVPTTSSH
jgi:tyrosine-protein phosphatase SIW14